MTYRTHRKPVKCCVSYFGCDAVVMCLWCGCDVVVKWLWSGCDKKLNVSHDTYTKTNYVTCVIANVGRENFPIIKGSMKKFYILITHDITTRLTLVDLGNFRVQTSIIELCRINSINSIIEATNLRHSLELITKNST